MGILRAHTGAIGCIGLRSVTVKCKSIAVLQSLSDNQPDVDAIYRITMPMSFSFRQIQETKPLLLPTGVLTPYNAQATLTFKQVSSNSCCLSQFMVGFPIYGGAILLKGSSGIRVSNLVVLLARLLSRNTPLKPILNTLKLKETCTRKANYLFSRTLHSGHLTCTMALVYRHAISTC